jgi:hypothetical protein
VKEEPAFLLAMNAANRGVLVEELSDELRGLVKRVLDTGKAGTMDLKIKVDTGGHGRVVMTVNSKLTAPKEDAEGTILFVDEDGNLSRRKSRPGQTVLRMDSSEDEDDE